MKRLLALVAVLAIGLVAQVASAKPYVKNWSDGPAAARGSRASRSRTWTPTAIPSVKLFLDPNVALTGTTLKTWSDSVHSISFVQQASDSSAYVNGHSINSQATVDMTGTTFLQSSSVLSAVASASSYWVFSVFRYTGSHAEDGSTAQPAIIRESASYLTKEVSTTKYNNKHFDGAQQNDQGTIATSTNEALYMQYDGSKIKSSLNGAALNAGTSAGNVQNLTNVLQVGTNTFVGSYGCILFGNPYLDAAQLTKIQAWAANLFNVAGP